MFDPNLGNSNAYIDLHPNPNVQCPANSATAGARFGSHPVLHDPWFPNVPGSYYDASSGLHSESDLGAAVYLDSLCLHQSTTPSTTTTRTTATSLGDCLFDLNPFLEPPFDYNIQHQPATDFEFIDFGDGGSGAATGHVDNQLSYLNAFDHSIRSALLSDADRSFGELGGVELVTASNAMAACWDPEEGRDTRSAPPSPVPYRRKRSSSSHKLWTEMGESEQMKIVQNLTDIVSTEMDVFEQLEIIRILQPDAKLARYKNEFVVELSMLDNHKYRHIRDLLRLQGISLRGSDRKNRSCVDDCHASAGHRRHTKQEIRLLRQKRFLKLRQRKDRLQLAREERSGLFEFNETLSVKSNAPDEDTDIDILS